MILELENVSKRIGIFDLDNISFGLPEGFVMGLVGPNGAGKTSLLNIILGLYKPQVGAVRVAGMNYQENEREIKELLGAVLVDELFEGEFSLKENGNFYGKYYKNYEETLLLQYIERFKLDAKKKYKALSKGEKLKFSFAFALSHQPRLLILDEPTANFDPSFRKEFFEVIKEFIADGTRSVILATHLTDDLDKIADYLLYLEDGKALVATDIETFRQSYRMVTGEAYKIRLLKDDVIYMEQRELSTRALVRHHGYRHYELALTVTTPTIEEFMYYQTKRKKKKRK